MPISRCTPPRNATNRSGIQGRCARPCDKKTGYNIALTNPHIQSVEVLGQSCVPDARHTLRLAAVEHCSGVLTLSEYFDGMSRETPGKVLLDYANHFAHRTIETGSEPHFIVRWWPLRS